MALPACCKVGEALLPILRIEITDLLLRKLQVLLGRVVPLDLLEDLVQEGLFQEGVAEDAAAVKQFLEGQAVRHFGLGGEDGKQAIDECAFGLVGLALLLAGQYHGFVQ